MVDSGILRVNFEAIVLSDTPLLNMLGNGANSVLPHAGYRAPIPAEKLPGVELQVFGEVSYDTLQLTTGLRWRVYDSIEQNFTRIDRIIGRLLQLYKSDVHINYNDPVAHAYWQRLTNISPDTMDDGFSQHCRWVEWQVWRAKP